MKFNLSKYGIITVAIYSGYFLFIFLVDPSETGPLGFLQYISLLFYIPVYIFAIFIPILRTSPLISFILGLFIFYFIGVGIQKLASKK